MNYVEHLDLFGVEAKEIPCIKGIGVPTTATVGATGLLYMDTDTGDLYKCTDVTDGVYTWEPVGGSNEPGIVKETDPTVCSWAKRELFNKENLVDPANRNSFVTIDGVEYYRYHCSAQNFEYYNPVPKQGSVTINYRVVNQYNNGIDTRFIVHYEDGSTATINTVSGVAGTFTTNASKTFVKLTGNYDMENWALLDMSVMSMMASYDKDVLTETDPTLSVEGKAADAKAVGDALANFGDVAAFIEPAEDDIPKVYFTGTPPESKSEGDVKCTVHYISKTAEFEYPATLKVQGGLSTSYAKKNFTLKMYEDDTYEDKVKYAFKEWGKLNKWVLKAHWIDHSHVRNVGTAKIWGKIVRSRSDFDTLPEELRTAPNNGGTDGFTCKVFFNGVYWGLYEWIVPKDKLFGQDSDNAAHSIMGSELNNQASCAFATTTPTINGNWSEELHDEMSADISTSFANFITFVAGATDEEFVANAENHFDVQSVIDYDILARVFCVVDNLCRNQIFFTYDGTKWYEGAWDLDAILGLPPTVRGFFAYNTEFQTGYVAYKDYGITNMLYQRVETLFTERFKERYAELRASVLSIDNIIEVYERLTDVLKTYDGLLEEDFASTTGNGAFTGIPYTAENTIQQLRNFVAKRLPYMDEAVAAITADNDTSTEEVPCTGISLSASELIFTEAGTQTLTATVEPDGCTDEVVWESTDSSVATVSNGVVTAKANGSATITATCGEYSASCEVSVSGISEETGEDESGSSDASNILDGITFTSGFIRGQDGTFGVSAADAYTDAIDISGYVGQTIWVEYTGEGDMSQDSRFAYYDADGAYVGYTNFNELPATIPPAKWMRISVKAVKFGELILKMALPPLDFTGNLHTAETIRDGAYNWISGVFDENDTGSCTTDIPVSAGELYEISYCWGIFFFAEDGELVEIKYRVVHESVGIIAVPGGAATMGVCSSDKYLAGGQSYVRKASNTTSEVGRIAQP